MSFGSNRPGSNIKIFITSLLFHYLIEHISRCGPGRIFITLYFDQQTGYLVRSVRYVASPIGRMPTQVDYADYRDIGGIKYPYQQTFTWLDGRDTFTFTDVKFNVPIDPAKFGEPVLPARP